MSTWSFSVLDQKFLLYIQTYPQGTNNLIFAHGEITDFSLLHIVMTTLPLTGPHVTFAKRKTGCTQHASHI